MPKFTYPPTDHCDGRRFFNIHASTGKTLGDILRYRRERRGPDWPRHAANPSYPPPPSSLGRGEVAVTFVGHATFLIQVDGLAILTDPVFSQRVGPLGRVGPVRVRPPGLRLDELPPVDLVLLSHNHYDHLDVPSLRALAARGTARFITGLGNGAYLERRRIPGVEELDWWDGTDLPGKARVTFLPAQHWSFRARVPANTTLWGGFMVETEAATLYFAGDTGYCPHFGEIGARFSPIDVALLPIGAFEPRWFMAPQHMGPDEAVRAHLDLRARVSVAMHFGTFRLTPEAIDAPVEGLNRALAASGLSPRCFRIPGFGETIRVAARKSACDGPHSAPSLGVQESGSGNARL